MNPSDLRVVELTSAQTHDLRRRVLRVGTPSQDVTYPQDDEPNTFHLGALLDGVLVGVSTWAPEPWPDDPTGEPAVRLRGMAVDHTLQRGGVGGALVQAGIDRAAARGATWVWASARDSALGFYEQLGFEVMGDEFTDTATGMPHHLIRIRCRPSPAAAPSRSPSVRPADPPATRPGR